MSKCDNCEVRKVYAKLFDMHWFDESDCPVNCKEDDEAELPSAIRKKMEQTDFSTTLSKIIADSNISVRELERKSGVSREAIRRWLTGTVSARIELAECVLNVLGYRLEVVKCRP